MLSAENIIKTYGTLQVLKSVSLKIKAGEFVSIIGKSGAGKSTLLQILGSLDKPDSGSVIIDGIDITSLTKKEIANFRNKKIGFVFQFHHLLPEFTALENVCLPGLIYKKDKKEVTQRAKELLVLLGLADRILHRPTQLSGGEQQRVAIARALINDPAIVFADEPTGNLDSATSQELHQLLIRLKTDLNKTFIIVTHNLELAALSDRTLIMKDGTFKTES